jgi:hypothetical protein
MPRIDISEDTHRRLLARVRSFDDTPDDVIRRLLDDEVESEPPSPSRIGSRRAPPGSILPEREYWRPMLAIIDATPGGRMAANDVIEEVGRVLRDRFTTRDLEELEMGEVRWRNRVRFARLRMKEAGLLNGAAPRGVWEITVRGREYLRAQ